MANTDTDTDARYYPPPASAPLQQVAQQLPPVQPSTRGDRLDRIAGYQQSPFVPAPAPPAPAPPAAQPAPQPPAEQPAPLDMPRRVQIMPGPTYQYNPNNQRFTPAQPRPTSELGKPTWAITALPNYPDLEHSTHLPAQQEAYGVERGTGRQLAMHGPPAVAGPARIFGDIAGIIGPFLDFYSHNAFSEHYRNTRLGMTREQEAQQRMEKQRLDMQLEQVGLLHEQMLEQGAQAIASSSDILTEYGRVINDGNLSPEQKEAAIRALNYKHGWSSLDNTLNNQGMDGVIRELQWNDQRLRDHWSAYTVLDQASKKKKEEAGDPGADLLEGGDKSARNDLIRKQEDQDPTTAAPDAASAPTATDTAKRVEKIRKDAGINDTIGLDAAREILETGKLGRATPGQIGKSEGYRRGEVAARQMGKLVGDKLAGPGTLDEKLDDIGENISPTVASNIKGLLDFKTDLNKDIPREVRNQYQTWAQRADPNWRAGNYKAVNDYFGANTQNARLILRADAFPTAGLTVLKQLKPVSETEAIPMRIIDQGGSFYVTGDPKYSNLNQAIQGYINEFAGLLSANGVPRVTQLQILREHFKSSMSPAQIRGALQIDAQDANSIVDGVNARWRQVSGRNTLVPGYRPESDAVLKGILGMNAKTGEVPDDDNIPNELRAVGKKPLPKGQRPGWMTDKDAASPLTRAQRTYWENWLKTHPRGTPGWDEINEQLGINR